MGINKVQYGSTTLIDLTGDTVMPENLLNGETAHNAAGEPIVGTASGGDISTIINAIYPIGSIYMSVNNTDPSILFEGTTWEAWGSGKVPVGVDTDDTDFDTAEETGGAKTENYTPSGSTASVTLTAAQSGVPAHSHGLNSHKHSVGAHAHGLNSHTHTINHGHSMTQPAFTVTNGGVTNGITGGSHSHTYKLSAAAQYAAGGWGIPDTNGSASASTVAATHTHTLPNHSHTVTRSTNAAVTSMTGSSGAATGSTANSTAFDTGAATGSTANNTASAASEGHSHSFTGTQASISHLQPYITCYMWKRTA